MMPLQSVIPYNATTLDGSYRKSYSWLQREKSHKRPQMNVTETILPASPLLLYFLSLFFCSPLAFPWIINLVSIFPSLIKIPFSYFWHSSHHNEKEKKKETDTRMDLIDR